MKKFIKNNFFCILLCILLLAIITTYSIRTYNSMYKYNMFYKQHELLKDEIQELKHTIDSLNNEINSRTCNWKPLVDAMIIVESKGNELAVGNNGDYGVLQIRKIMIDECNNILKSKNINKLYVHNDAFNKDKSIEIFHIIADKYVPDGNYEKMARIWNGGPTAYNKYITKNNEIIENKYYTLTNDYWEKVKNELNKQKNII